MVGTLRTDTTSRLRLMMVAVSVTYAFRAWNLTGNDRAQVAGDMAAPWLWPVLYGAGAVLLAVAAWAVSGGGMVRRSRAVLASTLLVVAMSLGRAWAVAVGPFGGVDSLHLVADFAASAVVIAATWPFQVRGVQILGILKGDADDATKVDQIRKAMTE